MGEYELLKINDYISEAEKGVNNLHSNEDCLNAIKSASEKIIEKIKQGSKIYSFGNGGSMTDAMHFAEELTGRFRKNRKPISAISISDPAHITCVANDFGFENIFSRFLEANANNDDIILAISTSGNSPNIIRACKYAKDNNINVIGLTGKENSKLNEFSDIVIKTPCGEYSDHVRITWNCTALYSKIY